MEWCHVSVLSLGIYESSYFYYNATVDTTCTNCKIFFYFNVHNMQCMYNYTSIFFKLLELTYMSYRCRYRMDNRLSVNIWTSELSTPQLIIMKINKFWTTQTNIVIKRSIHYWSKLTGHSSMASVIEYVYMRNMINFILSMMIISAGVLEWCSMVPNWVHKLGLFFSKICILKIFAILCNVFTNSPKFHKNIIKFL